METEEISDVKTEGMQHQSKHEVSQGQVAKRPLSESNEITENVRNVTCVVNHCQARGIYKGIIGPIQERDLFNARCVNRSLIEEKS